MIDADNAPNIEYFDDVPEALRVMIDRAAEKHGVLASRVRRAVVAYEDDDGHDIRESHYAVRVRLATSAPFVAIELDTEVPLDISMQDLVDMEIESAAKSLRRKVWSTP